MVWKSFGICDRNISPLSTNFLMHRFWAFLECNGRNGRKFQISHSRQWIFVGVECNVSVTFHFPCISFHLCRRSLWTLFWIVKCKLKRKQLRDRIITSWGQSHASVKVNKKPSSHSENENPHKLFMDLFYSYEFKIALKPFQYHLYKFPTQCLYGYEKNQAFPVFLCAPTQTPVFQIKKILNAIPRKEIFSVGKGIRKRNRLKSHLKKHHILNIYCLWPSLLSLQIFSFLIFMWIIFHFLWFRDTLWHVFTFPRLSLITRIFDVFTILHNNQIIKLFEIVKILSFLSNIKHQHEIHKKCKLKWIFKEIEFTLNSNF